MHKGVIDRNNLRHCSMIVTHYQKYRISTTKALILNKLATLNLSSDTSQYIYKKNQSNEPILFSQSPIGIVLSNVFM